MRKTAIFRLCKWKGWINNKFNILMIFFSMVQKLFWKHRFLGGIGLPITNWKSVLMSIIKQVFLRLIKLWNALGLSTLKHFRVSLLLKVSVLCIGRRAAVSACGLISLNTKSYFGKRHTALLGCYRYSKRLIKPSTMTLY